MLKQLACLIVIALAPFSARAELVSIGPPACAGQTLQDFMKFGQSGCQLGGFTFKDFSLVPHSEFQPVTANGIAVTLTDLGNAFQLHFASNNFVVTGGQSSTFAILFEVDPPPVIIRGFDEEMFTETPVFPGLASIATDLCIGGVFPTCEPGSTAGLFLFHDGQRSNLRAGLTFPNVNVLDVQFLVNLDARQGGSADFSSFTATVLLDIPEPASAMLIGGGLLALAFIGRRRLG